MIKITRPFALIVLFFICSVSFAQDKLMDSLKTAFENPKMHDTTRMNYISHILRDRYTQNNPNYYLMVRWLGKIAQKNTDSKVPAVRKSANMWLATYYNGLAIEAFVKGRINESVPYVDKAIAIYKSEKAHDEMYYQYIIKSQFLQRTNQTEKAVVCLFAALRHYEKKPRENATQIAYALSTLSNIYMTQKDYANAIAQLKKVIALYDGLPASEMNGEKQYLKSIAYSRLGTCHKQLHEYEKAVGYYDKSVAISRKLGDVTNQQLNAAQMGMLLLDQEKYDQAEKVFTELMAAKMDKRSEAHHNIAMARIYLERKDYAKARDYAEKGLALSTENKYLDLQEPAGDFLFRISKGSGDYKRALEMYEFNNKLKDSSKMEASKNELLRQQLRYDAEKKELQLRIEQQRKVAGLKLAAEKNKLEIEKKATFERTKDRLARQQLRYGFEKRALNQKIVQGKRVSAIRLQAEKENAEKNNWLMGLSGLLVVLTLGGTFYYRNSKQKQAITVLEKNQIRQKLLVTQMNPHFIFNSIGNIQGLIQGKKDAEAVDYLTKFSKLTRQILENSNENYIPLSEEVEMTRNYLAIQQLLYDNKFAYDINIEQGIDQEAIFLPPMLTQPFIENAIKHGLSSISGEGKIGIHFYLREGKLFFEVSDNGRGFDASKKQQGHKSLAMTITRERLVGYTKNQDFTVQADNILDSQTNVVGAKVVFEIPYIYEN